MRRRAWPGGAWCVVAVTVDWDGTSVEIDEGQVPLGAFSHGRYSAKRGIPRYLGLLARHGVPATFFIPGYDAEGRPDVVRAIDAAGHEIGAHGYMHEGHDLGEAEPGLLRKTHDILTAITGKAPKGWRSPSGRKTARTVEVLRALGYRYDSSEKDHDYPYIARMDGRDLDDYVVLPNNTSSLDDYPFFDLSFTPASEVLAHWKQEFDAIHAEGGYYNLVVHPRTGYGSGSPARARAVDALLAYMKGFAGVRFVRLGELADWCLADPAAWRLPQGQAHG